MGNCWTDSRKSKRVSSVDSAKRSNEHYDLSTNNFAQNNILKRDADKNSETTRNSDDDDEKKSFENSSQVLHQQQQDKSTDFEKLTATASIKTYSNQRNSNNNDHNMCNSCNSCNRDNDNDDDLAVAGPPSLLFPLSSSSSFLNCNSDSKFAQSAETTSVHEKTSLARSRDDPRQIRRRERVSDNNTLSGIMTPRTTRTRSSLNNSSFPSSSCKKGASTITAIQIRTIEDRDLPSSCCVNAKVDEGGHDNTTQSELRLLHQTYSTRTERQGRFFFDHESEALAVLHRPDNVASSLSEEDSECNNLIFAVQSAKCNVEVKAGKVRPILSPSSSSSSSSSSTDSLLQNDSRIVETSPKRVRLSLHDGNANEYETIEPLRSNQGDADIDGDFEDVFAGAVGTAIRSSLQDKQRELDFHHSLAVYARSQQQQQTCGKPSSSSSPLSTEKIGGNALVVTRNAKNKQSHLLALGNTTTFLSGDERAPEVGGERGDGDEVFNSGTANSGTAITYKNISPVSTGILEVHDGNGSLTGESICSPPPPTAGTAPNQNSSTGSSAVE